VINVICGVKTAVFLPHTLWYHYLMTKAIRQDPENSELDALHDFVGSFAGKRVLEIGCGNGRLTYQYAAEAALIHGIDPSETKIAEAQEKMQANLQNRLEFWNVGIENFFAPEPYDIVMLAWSL
jgi:2-polyprenyl-3-methyl-5-hydroxy-6-metoxy-1,4-benzoquinol methylase